MPLTYGPKTLSLKQLHSWENLTNCNTYIYVILIYYKLIGAPNETSQGWVPDASQVFLVWFVIELDFIR